MRRYLALALASVLAAIPVSALAMGLGEIRLDSHLNQRLDAEIELVAAAANELESLEIGLASREAFDRYGLLRPAVLSSLQFSVERRPNGTAYIRITSTEPVREPFLTFLVEADWASGRVLREYTVLLDPPTFATQARQAEPAEAQSPVVTPAPAMREPAPEPAPTRAEPAPEQPRAAETVTGDVIDIPSLDEEPAPRPIPGPAVTPEMGDTYGPIQRNETLWGIARRLRPDESVTINQMMLALYRANPEAFQGNINRLKAGYILRIPDFSDITAISRSDAFREVKRQNEAWRGGSAPAAPSDAAPAVEPEPELSLVAPEEDITTGAGLGADSTADETSSAVGAGAPLGDDTTDAPGEPAGEASVDLGVETDSPERLLDVEDESLQALQEQDDLLADVEAPAADENMEAPPLPETGLEAAGEQPLAETAGETESVPVEVPAENDAASEPAAPVVAPMPVRAEPGLVEKLANLVMSPLGLGLAAAILVLVLAGVLVIRKRREAVHAKAAAAMAEWEEDGDVTVLADNDDDADGEDAETGSVFAHGMEHEDTGTTRLEDDAEATQLLEDADKTQVMGPDDAASGGGDDFADTVFGGQAVTLDDNDPLSEADFHMAYGLYDQAAEVVEKAVEREPTRKDYLAKLAEIHFAANNQEGFLEAAGKLKALASDGDSDWENVAIMGRQMAPDSDLFGEAGSASSVDLDFGSADEEFGGEETVAGGSTPDVDGSGVADSLDFDMPMDSDEDTAEPAAGEDAPDSPLDLDALAGEDSAAEPESTPESTDGGLDFDLDIDGADESAAEPVSAEPENPDSDFDFDLDDLGGETAATPGESGGEDGYSDDDTQTEFDKALEELSAFVDTNIPESDAGDAVNADDSGLSLDDYSFDQDDAAAGEPAEDFGGEGIGEDEDDIGEIGTKLDLARAYIDMGDPDGARSILEEVVADGDETQQKEARELLDQLA